MCKPNEIYLRMCDVYREAYLRKKRVKWAKHEPEPKWRSAVNVEETHGISRKENILGAVASKEGHADSLLGHKRTCHLKNMQESKNRVKTHDSECCTFDL